jgi:IclR family transcriptional regulator, KDG regulon repressor
VAEAKTKPSIQVIERMMNLLDALARHDAPANLKELAHETRLHPSTAHRILNVMVRNRVVERIEPGTYRLGMRLLELGTLVHSRQQLSQQLGETVGLAARC